MVTGAEARPLAPSDVWMPEQPQESSSSISAAVEVGEADPAVLLGDVGVHQPDLPGLVDDVLGPGAVLVVLPSDGTDLLLGEVVRHVAQVLLLVGEREVDHVLSGSP